jgi:D-alanyl-lipoteichoic acid acyltransferase DltB (MBOAT superfamily)
MLFTNGIYFVFLIAAFFVYWMIAARVGWRIMFLALASCFIYSQGAGRALLLLVAVSLIDYSTTRLMARSESKIKRRLLLRVSLAIDIGALCVFKYANFFIDSTASAASLIGVSISPAHLDIIAPIGISFFIFQSIAYVIDVYRGDVEPAESYVDYLAFVSFFPTIVAGPILRARQLLPQLRKQVTLDPAMGGQALFLISIGLIKKFAIADYLSANLVDRIFDFPERFSSLEVLAAIYGYALEIYADFSGYSDIAIGSAMLFGFRLPANFNAPYRAMDLPDFWRRWHISLSTWLRDYVFFTIAGNRARNVTVLYCGLVVTMLVGGLWHGPTWAFVFWGLLHGTGLVAVRVFANARKRFGFAKRNSVWSRALGVLITFNFVCLAWVFFRAETLDRAIAMLGRLTTFQTDTANLSAPVLLIIALGFVAHFLPDGVSDSLQKGFIRLPALAQACVLVALAVGLYFVASSDVVPFIYSRF